MQAADSPTSYGMTKMYTTSPWKGWDLFVTPPGLHERLRCAVCGSGCKVDRDHLGPTGFAMAMGRRKVKHDRFECRHVAEAWHKKTRAILMSLSETPAP